jgi:tetratricopeptide (TPR) repeat protein
MKRSFLSVAALLICTIFVLESHCVAKDKWVSVRSEHFTVVGNARESDVREASVRLEEYYGVLARLFVTTPPSVPTTVFVFRNDESFKPFKPLYQGKPTQVAGYFQPGRDLNYIAFSAERKGASAYRTVFHEMVHLFIDNRLRGVPLCFSEGLAEYFSTLKVGSDGRRITFGIENAEHLRLLREKPLFPLQTLLAINYESPEYNDGDQQSLFYAQSWALVYFLLNKSGRPALDQFALLSSSLADGTAIDDALKHAFQADVRRIDSGLKAFVTQVPFPMNVQRYPDSVSGVRELAVTEIGEAEAKAHLGDLLLHLNRVDEAETLLSEALALNPELAAAKASLGMLRVKQQRASEGVEFLRRAVVSDPNNYLTQYYYAFALSREGMTGDGHVSGYAASTGAAMREALIRTRQLAPGFIEAYRLEAFLDLAVNQRLDEAEDLLKRAHALAPDRQDLLIVLAQVHLRRSNYSDARATLESVLRKPTELKIREQALGLVEDMKYAEEQVARFSRSAIASEQKPDESLPQPETPASERANSGSPRLARRFKGERVRGVLKRIECLDKGVALTVEADGRLLRLHRDELRGVFFVAYVAGLERSVTCGARNPENLVVLTYRPSTTRRANFDGEAIAIEFVPEDFEMEP